MLKTATVDTQADRSKDAVVVMRTGVVAHGFNTRIASPAAEASSLGLMGMARDVQDVRPVVVRMRVGSVVVRAIETGREADHVDILPSNTVTGMQHAHEDRSSARAWTLLVGFLVGGYVVLQVLPSDLAEAVREFLGLLFR